LLRRAYRRCADILPIQARKAQAAQKIISKKDGKPSFFLCFLFPFAHLLAAALLLKLTVKLPLSQDLLLRAALAVDYTHGQRDASAYKLCQQKDRDRADLCRSGEEKDNIEVLTLSRNADARKRVAAMTAA
jgi:hypothetical protein